MKPRFCASLILEPGNGPKLPRKIKKPRKKKKLFTKELFQDVGLFFITTGQVKGKRLLLHEKTKARPKKEGIIQQ